MTAATQAEHKPHTALRVVTNSELKARRRCAREHHYAYELGYRSAREDAVELRFGTLIHRALEAWWKEPDRDKRLIAALAALPLEHDDLYELARACEMLNGYDCRWRDTRLVALVVEHEFRIPLVHPLTGARSLSYQLGGKLDGIVRDEIDGRVYVIEHKTSSDDISVGSTYWQLLRIDTQVSTYYHAAREQGFDPSGVIYDVLAKPRHRPLLATPLDERKFRKDGLLYATQRDTNESPDEYQSRVRDAIAEAPDRYFARGTVVRLEGEEVEAGIDTWDHTVAIHGARLTMRWPRNPESCRRYGRMCSYFPVCTNESALDNRELYQRVDNVHSELTPDTTP